MGSDRRLDLLRRRGETFSLSSGEEAVNVTLQYGATLSGRSRSVRRKELQRAFHGIEGEVREHGGLLDFDSISVSAQTIEGQVPVAELEGLARDLQDDGIRMDVVTLNRLIP